MTRYVAFLRAINVGGHTVKMGRLRQLFESFGVESVETFIASGNVIFQSTDAAAALEKRIAVGLEDALGYQVVAFVRTLDELSQVVKYKAFPTPVATAAEAFSIAFLAEPLDGQQVEKLAAFETDIDSLTTYGREVYWLCRVKQSQSKFSGVDMERKLGIQTTFRSANTIQRIVAKYATRE